MFLRFVITDQDDISHRPKGLFVAADDLLESGELDAIERQQLDEILSWFERELPAPKMYASRAIFWYKSTARECISRMWELVHMMKRNGFIVEVDKYRELGNIIYEDDFQVAAYPSKRDRR